MDPASLPLVLADASICFGACYASPRPSFHFPRSVGKANSALIILALTGFYLHSSDTEPHTKQTLTKATSPCPHRSLYPPVSLHSAVSLHSERTGRMSEARVREMPPRTLVSKLSVSRSLRRLSFSLGDGRRARQRQHSKHTSSSAAHAPLLVEPKTSHGAPAAGITDPLLPPTKAHCHSLRAPRRSCPCPSTTTTTSHEPSSSTLPLPVPKRKRSQSLRRNSLVISRASAAQGHPSRVYMSIRWPSVSMRSRSRSPDETRVERVRGDHGGQQRSLRALRVAFTPSLKRLARPVLSTMGVMLLRLVQYGAHLIYQTCLEPQRVLALVLCGTPLACCLP